eukprot:1257239-Ditylum_brightwellii.AAC.1
MGTAPLFITKKAASGGGESLALSMSLSSSSLDLAAAIAAAVLSNVSSSSNSSPLSVEVGHKQRYFSHHINHESSQQQCQHFDVDIIRLKWLEQAKLHCHTPSKIGKYPHQWVPEGAIEAGNGFQMGKQEGQ